MVRSDRDIPPGGSGSVVVAIDTRAHEGRVRKTYTLASNDPLEPAVRLILEGVVVRPVELVAGTDVDWPVAREAEVRLARAPGYDWTLESATIDRNDARLERLVKEGDGIRLVVALGPPPATPGGVRSIVFDLRLRFDDGRLVEMPCRWTFCYRPRIDSAPRRTLYFSRAETASLLRSEASFVEKEALFETTRAPWRFDVLDVRSSAGSSSLFDLRWEPLASHRRYRLSVRLRAPYETVRRRVVTERLTVVTDAGDQEELQLTVAAAFR